GHHGEPDQHGADRRLGMREGLRLDRKFCRHDADHAVEHRCDAIRGVLASARPVTRRDRRHANILSPRSSMMRFALMMVVAIASSRLASVSARTNRWDLTSPPTSFSMKPAV